MKSWSLAPHLLTYPSFRVRGPVWYFVFFQWCVLMRPFWADSNCTRSPTTARRRSNPTETDPMPNSDYLNEHYELIVRNLQEKYPSLKRIDLRKVAFGGTKLRPSKFQKRRISLPTHTRSISYPTYEEQSLPQLSQPSIHDSGWLFHLEWSPCWYKN